MAHCAYGPWPHGCAGKAAGTWTDVRLRASDTRRLDTTRAVHAALAPLR